MLPSFVIGLREGLETVVILGAIAVFLRTRGRADLLRRIWRATAVAAVICGVVAIVLRLTEASLPWRQQEQFETIVGLAALLMVTYMVVWMRRFPKDLQRDSSSAAESALARDSGRALVVLAFFAVLREGFEIAVFVVATIGLTGSNAWLSTAGALLGIAVALIVGVAVVRGSVHLDVPRFFRISAFVLVLTAAGIAMTTANSANAAGWITFGQTPQYNLSWLAPPGSILSSFTTGMLGIQPYPVFIEAVAWLAYFVPMAAVVLWPRQRPHWSLPGRRATAAAGGVLAVLAMLTVGGAFAAHALASPAHPKRATTTAQHQVLFATLSDVTCPSVGQCVAVGDFLPYDKDAAHGDPDGDGQATHTLAETYYGKGWKVVTSPDAGKGGADLTGVSCPGRDDCVAVGFYRPAKFAAQAVNAPPSYPLAELYNGRSWRLMPSPAVPPNSILTSVSCPSARSCLAVGYTTTTGRGGSSESFFLERYAGGSWAVMPVAAPSGTSSGLNSVACTDDSDCVAVGNIAPAENPTSTRPLIEVFDHGTWTAAALPAAVDGRGILYDVSCASVGHCTAVGTSEARSTGAALVLASSGSTWAVDSSALAAAGDNSLTAVGCDAATDCYTTGTSWATLDSGLQNIVAGLPGWRELGSPSRAANIESLSCPGPDRCVAVGSLRRNTFGNTTALVTDFSEGTWDRQSTPMP